MFEISWTVRVTNDYPKKINQSRTLYTVMKERQIIFFGHMLRREAIRNHNEDMQNISLVIAHL